MHLPIHANGEEWRRQRKRSRQVLVMLPAARSSSSASWLSSSMCRGISEHPPSSGQPTPPPSPAPSTFRATCRTARSTPCRRRRRTATGMASPSRRDLGRADPTARRPPVDGLSRRWSGPFFMRSSASTRSPRPGRPRIYVQPVPMGSPENYYGSTARRRRPTATRRPRSLTPQVREHSTQGLLGSVPIER